MANTNRTEDDLGKKWDRCLSDTGIKIVSGLGLGIVFSVIFFKRRPWPVAFGTGIGLGMGYANCQNDFNSNVYPRGFKKVQADNGSPANDS
ncbi:MICOS complex subunit Mic10-like [Lineus longissimus]|uniref:MICOS complex subunit Mic10-like n=1 Tax=Lineus longissimus TaxID=88925 RepID=UPI002B4CD3D0